MDKVLVFSEIFPMDKVNGTEVVKVFSKEKIAHKLVSEENVRCLIVELTDPSDDFIKFLISVKTNFPLLEAAELSRDSGKSVSGYKHISTEKSRDDIISEIGDFIKQSENRNKRDSIRFSWPLTAWYSEDEVSWKEIEIFSISSSGAYLKTSSIFPEGGSSAFVKINFANFSIESKCEVVNSQTRSSNYPFGFSIKFTSITEEGKIILNNMVNDAVIKILMEPDSEPEIPSLDSEALTPGFTFF